MKEVSSKITYKDKDYRLVFNLNVMEKIQLSTLFITHDIDEAIMLSDRIYILTGKPGTITDEIVIAEGKDKSKDFNLTQEFLNYKQQIVAALKQ